MRVAGDSVGQRSEKFGVLASDFPMSCISILAHDFARASSPVVGI
jgi:hypothetical protein